MAEVKESLSFRVEKEYLVKDAGGECLGTIARNGANVFFYSKANKLKWSVVELKDLITLMGTL